MSSIANTRENQFDSNETKSLKKSASEVVGNSGVEQQYTSDTSGGCIAPPFTIKTSSTGETSAQTMILDDSFKEVVAPKRSRREDKQMAKEKMQEDKVTKKLSKTVRQKEQQ